MLDRYRLEHELGAGARGVLYRARNRHNGRLVTIKLSVDAAADSPPDGTGSSATQVASTSTRARFDHPQIPAVYETGTAGYLSYEVLAFVEGTDLRPHTDPAMLLPLCAVLSIGARIADALHYSHRRGVVHGDIKPANIIFDATTGRVALTDFPSDSRAICTIGTQAYMAPECLRGEIASPASDQFSLAVTLYQLLCGRHPFAGRSSPEIVRRMTAEPHTDIRVYTPSLPPTLVKLFDTALAKQPHRRYPDLTAMKKAISRIRAHMNTRACVESTERYNAHLSAL